jgi:osmotically-inducible protein OsmY
MTRSKAFGVLAAVVLTVSLTPGASGQSRDEARDVTPLFRGAAAVDRLQVFEIAGVLIIRGRVTDPAQSEAISRYAQGLGYGRVANLIQTVVHDDVELARTAERELSIHRALDGCRFTVRSVAGVVHVGGRVRHELQKDVALQVLRSIDGVSRVEVNLQRF